MRRADEEWRCDLQFFAACLLAGVLLAAGMLAVGYVRHGGAPVRASARAGR